MIIYGIIAIVSLIVILANLLLDEVLEFFDLEIGGAPLVTTISFFSAVFGLVGVIAVDQNVSTPKTIALAIGFALIAALVFIRIYSLIKRDISNNEGVSTSVGKTGIVEHRLNNGTYTIKTTNSTGYPIVIVGTPNDENEYSVNSSVVITAEFPNGNVKFSAQ